MAAAFTCLRQPNRGQSGNRISPTPANRLTLPDTARNGCSSAMRDAELDSFDRKILGILQRDNSTSQREIACQVNLSPAAVHRRIHRLHASGVIAANSSVLSPDKIGRPISVIV